MYDRTIEGNWWRPDAPNERYGGRLSFSSSSGCRLEVLGPLAPDGPFSVYDVRLPVIHGSVRSQETGNGVTLFDCFRAGLTTQGEFHRQEFTCALAALGPHLTSHEQLRVRTCELSFTQLPSWLMVSGFDIKFQQRKWKSGQALKYTLKYTPVRLPPILTAVGKITFKLRS